MVERYVEEHLSEWQANGWVPDMRIEVGGPPRYQGRDLVQVTRLERTGRHLFNASSVALGGPN